MKTISSGADLASHFTTLTRTRKYQRLPRFITNHLEPVLYSLTIHFLWPDVQICPLWITQASLQANAGGTTRAPSASTARNHLVSPLILISARNHSWVSNRRLVQNPARIAPSSEPRNMYSQVSKSHLIQCTLRTRTPFSRALSWARRDLQASVS